MLRLESSRLSGAEPPPPPPLPVLPAPRSLSLLPSSTHSYQSGRYVPNNKHKRFSAIRTGELYQKWKSNSWSKVSPLSTLRENVARGIWLMRSTCFVRNTLKARYAHEVVISALDGKAKSAGTGRAFIRPWGIMLSPYMHVHRKCLLVYEVQPRNVKQAHPRDAN